MSHWDQRPPNDDLIAAAACLAFAAGIILGWSLGIVMH